MQFVRIGVAVVLAAYSVLFAVRNTESVPIELPFIAEGILQGWLVVVLAGAFGAFAASMVMSWPMMRLSGQHRRDTRRISQLEQELHGLRTLPLSTTPEKPEVSNLGD